MNTSFLTRFQNLNPEQKKAVEKTEGPVMVIAGPGTGKTETLGARIANILQKQTDILPANILCLTYTNAGVVAMRKRLLEFLGPSAHKVQIHTFHSFCNQIIQENADFFGVHDAENISELEQHELVEKILDDLPARHPLFKKHGYYYVSQLLGLFQTIKSENWSVEMIEKAVKNFLDDLPNREEFVYKVNSKHGKKGDIKQKAVEEQHEKMEKLLAGVRLFDEYQSRMQKKGAYDFSDMILWILSAFEKNESLLAKYQEQFLYVLVDEFQDTNGSQKKLVDFLISYWESPNIFVVGDDDQSIYRFQGANMRNILEFWTQHKDTVEVITIDKNYRSSPQILDLAEHIISQNSERLLAEIPQMQKKLSAHNPRFAEESQNFSPRLVEYYNFLHEELGILKKLKAFQQKNIPLSEVAVIYQNHKQVENILKMCESEKIPVRVKETQNILQLPLIKNLLIMLEYFAEETKNPFSGEHLLFQMLFFPWFKIPVEEISALALQRRNSQNTQKNQDTQNPQNFEEKFFKTILQQKNSPPLEGSSEGGGWFAEQEQHTTKRKENFEESAGFFAPKNHPAFITPPKEGKKWKIGKIFQLEKDFFSLSLVHFVEAVFEKTGVLEWILHQPEKAFLLRSLSSFFDFLKDQAKKNPDLTLAEFLQMLQRLKTHGLSLPIQKVAYEKEGVNFITAHSSKGLEFEYVFVMGVDKKIWDRPRKSGDFSFPDTLSFSNTGDFLEEKRRLFFVAITRAKKFLEISYSEKDENGKELDPSVFVSQCQEKILPEKKSYTEEEISDYQMRLLHRISDNPHPSPLPGGEGMKGVDKKFLEPLLENYRMSATHLNKFLACPLAFYYENLLRIPSAMTPHATFGSAVHFALENFFSPSVETRLIESLRGNFEYFLHKNRFAFTAKEYSKFLEHGKLILEEYFKENLHTLSPKNIEECKVEYSIKTSIDEIPVSGKIDRIDFVSPNLVKVVDYKTGNPEDPKTKKRMEKPSEKNDFLGGDYWRQMVFYALLLDNNPFAKWKMEEGIFDFVEPSKNPANANKNFVQAHFSISEEEKETVKEQMKSAYAQIVKGQFFGCGKEDCAWCGRI